MAPELTAQGSGNRISVHSPEAGSSVSIQSEPNAVLALEFNPADATMSREGNDLVFELDSGGTVTLQNFFEVGDEPLPDFLFPDGTEVASADFLSGVDFDISTAAGPAGGTANPSSGSGEYADDPGAAINGVNRIGMLGTDYWGRATEVPEVYSGVDAGGSFSFGVTTDLGDFQIVVGAYEDGQPYQHLDGQQDAPTNASQINFYPEPNAGSAVGEILFWDLPEGTLLYLGDPSNDPGAVPLSSIGGVYTFNADNFTNPGVYIVPAGNTDGDFDFSASVRFNGPNNSVTVEGVVTVIVDAVADKPDMDDAGFDDTGHTGNADIDPAEGGFDGKGWHETDQRASGDESLTVTIPFEATINYGDFTDSSETHYALIQVPGGPEDVDWRCLGENGVAYEVVYVRQEPDSGEYFMYDEDGDVIAGPLVAGQVAEGEYFRIPVDAENGNVTHVSVDADTGKAEVTVNVSLEASGDTGNLTDGSVPPVSVGGMTQEHPDTNDGETDLTNNAAFDWQHEVPVPLDVINSILTVEAGWASETNNDAKHLGTASDGYEKAADAGFDGNSTVVDSGFNQGAPVIFTLSGGENAAESVEKIELSYDGARGGLTYSGSGTAEFSTDPDTGKVTVTITGGDLTAELANGALIFTPVTDSGDSNYYNDTDVDLHYTLTVGNGTGVTATYEGDTVIALDAVADKPADLSAQTDYDQGMEAAALGETISISGSVTFPDMSGKAGGDAGSGETHFILLNLSQALEAGWTLPDGYALLSQSGAYEAFESVGGSGLNLTDSNALAPVSGDPDTPEYLLIQVSYDSDGNIQYHVVSADGDGNPMYTPISGDKGDDSGIGIAYDPDSDSFSYDVSLTAPSDAASTGDSSSPVWVKPITVVNDSGDVEYDYANNIAWEDPARISVDVSVATSTVGVTVTSVFEGDNWDKHVGNAALEGGGKITISQAATSTDPNADPSGEAVTAIALFYGNGEGAITVSGVEVPPGGGLVFTWQEVGETIVYTGAQVVDANGDAVGDPITIDPAQSFDEFVNSTLDIRYTPSEGSYSDADVKVDIVATVTDPDSGDTKVVSSDPSLSNAFTESMTDGLDTDKVREVTESEAGGTVIVDAVADKPGTSFVDGDSNGKVDVTYPEGQTSAKPGETVTLEDITVTFGDYKDGSESHYLVVQCKDMSTSSGNQFNTLPDQTLTMTGNGHTLVMEIVGGKIVSITVDGADQNNNAEYAQYLNLAVSTAKSIDGGSYFQIPVPDGFLELTEGSVTTDITIGLPKNGFASDQTPSIQVGGMAQESNSGTDDNKEIRTDNNTAYDLKDADIKVDVVTSTPVVKATQTYENSHSDANKGFVDISREFNDDGTAKAPEADIAILKDSAAILYVNGMKDTVSSGNPGEAITKASFTVDHPGSDDVPGLFMYKGVLLPANATGYITGNGDVVFTEDFSDMPEGAVKFTTETGDHGTATITLEGDGISLTQAGGELRFVPDQNFDSTDLDLDSSITVTDHGSNHSVTTTTTDGKTTVTDHNTGTTTSKTTSSDTDIKVDAVAQQPDLENIRVEGYQEQAATGTEDATYYNKIAHGQDAHVRMEIDLHGDISDGTEGHVFYVQSEAGYPVKSVTLTYTGVDGEEYSVTVSMTGLGLQRTNLGSGATGTYQTLNIESVINEYAAQQGNPGAKLGEGSIAVDVTVGTPPSGSTGTTIDVGVSAHEDWYAVQAGGDAEPRDDNNDAWQSAEVVIELSSAGQPGFTIGGVFYENSNATAHLGTETWGAGVPVGVNLGDANDALIDFSLGVTDPDLGGFYIFGDEEGYTYADFVADVKADNGLSPYDLLAGKYAGHVTVCGSEIDMDELGGHLDDADNLADKHQIVFMPAENSDAGTNPTLTGNIVVQDKESGQYKDTAGHSHDKIATDQADGETDLAGIGKDIIADAVAQRPEDASLANAEGGDIGREESRVVTVEATFNDTDGSTEHFILIEAGAGWTITYTYNDNADGTSSGKSYTVNTADLVIMEQGGTIYYKLPVSVPDGYDGGDSWTAKTDITLTAPSGSIHKGDYSFEVIAASRDKDTADGELTFHNNTASIEVGEASGTVAWGKDGTYIFEQRAALYEDNRPNSHLGDNDTTAKGLFLVGHKDCAGGTVVIECPTDAMGNALLTIDGADWDQATHTWIVPLDKDGNVDGGLKVSLSDAYIASAEGAHNDADLSFGDVVFKNNLGETQATIPGTVAGSPNPGLAVAVDAVADRGSSTVEDAGRWDGKTTDESNRLEDAVVGGNDDKTAYFTVTASFPDSDGSETHFVLVEQTPAWVIEGAETVYVDGTSYYKIPVNASDITDGEVSLEIGMTYTGSGSGNAADIFDKESETKGVTEYELKVGTLTQESDLSGAEGDIQNNVAVNIDGSVTLEYSPATSTVNVTVTPDSYEETGFNPITIHVDLDSINTADTQDELTGMTFSISPAIGKLYFEGDYPNGTAIDLSKPIDLAALEAAGGKLVYVPDNDYNHQDVTVSWTGTVRDIVSGAEENISGSATVVIDAAADLPVTQDIGVSDANVDGTTGVVTSGGSAIITVEADFPDLVNASEHHYAVVSQSDRAYSVTGAVIYDKDGNVLTTLGQSGITTMFDANGKPYFAVELPKVDGCYVEFTVTTPATTTDTSKTLQAGTIVIDTTKDTSANGETSYDNNWESSLENVTIHTGLLQTLAADVTLSVTGATEDQYAQVSFTAPKLAGYHETAEITVTGVTPAGTFYEKDEYGEYQPVTVLDGAKAAAGEYYFKADADDWSGNVTINYSVKVTDVNSGATKTYEKTASVTVAETADKPEVTSDENVNANAVVTAGNPHEAAFTATFTATYGDTADGSETQYFVWQLPAGMELGSAMLGQAALSILPVPADMYTVLGLAAGGNYVYAALPKGTSAAEITASFTVDHTYTEGSVIGTAVAGEDTHYTGGAQWAVSDESITVDVTVPSLNQDPSALGDGAAVAAGGLSTSGTVDTGDIFTDADGDVITVSGIQGSEDTIPVATDGSSAAHGEYGSLVMNSDGSFTYSLENNGDEVVRINAGSSDTFSIFGEDGYGGGAESTLSVDFEHNYFIGTAEGDTIEATDGGDILLGGAGDDLFVWSFDAMNQSASDSIFGFEYSGESNTGDKIVFENMFASEEELGSLINSLTGENGIFATTKADNGVQVEATFTDNELILTLHHTPADGGGESVAQTISVGFDSLPDGFGAGIGAEDAQDILNNIIRVNTGG